MTNAMDRSCVETANSLCDELLGEILKRTNTGVALLIREYGGACVRIDEPLAQKDGRPHTPNFFPGNSKIERLLYVDALESMIKREFFRPLLGHKNETPGMAQETMAYQVTAKGLDHAKSIMKIDLSSVLMNAPLK